GTGPERRRRSAARRCTRPGPGAARPARSPLGSRPSPLGSVGRGPGPVPGARKRPSLPPSLPPRGCARAFLQYAPRENLSRVLSDNSLLCYIDPVSVTHNRDGKEAPIMLMRTDPFRELDRLTQQVFGTATRPTAMPMDAYRHGDSFYVHLD